MTPYELAALTAALKLPCPAFPCDAEKRPTVSGGFKAALTADYGLASMWLRNPGVLIGVPTGTTSGFSVLDVDIHKGGDVWWNANKDRLPTTRQHETRSGGVHVLFKHREGIRTAAGRIGRGVDTRGEGGYIIWWPAHGFSVVDHPLAEWPDWLRPPEPEAGPFHPSASGLRQQLAIWSEGARPGMRGHQRRPKRGAGGHPKSGVLQHWSARRSGHP